MGVYEVIEGVVQDTSQVTNGKSAHDEWAESYRKTLEERLDRNSERTDAVRLNHKLDALARKVSRGDGITSNERRFMIDKDAEKLYKAERANHSKTIIEQRLKHADSSQSVEGVLKEARTEIELHLHHDEAYGELLADAVNELVGDYVKKEEAKLHYLKYQTFNIKA